MKHNPSLDGIRALAALAVAMFHCKLPFTPGGFIGVDVFFVLSGFLITSLLKSETEQTGTIALTQFYVRRALRLWPPLLVFLAVYAVAAPVLFAPASVWQQLALAGLYLADYGRAFWGEPSTLTHTWSLSVEEHFYMLWPAVILLISRRCSDRQAVVLLLGLFVAASMWRMIDLIAWGDWRHTYFRFDTRMSGLILGAAVAYLPWRPSASQANLLGIAGLIGMAAAIALLDKYVLALLPVGMLIDMCSAALVLAAIQEGSIIAGALRARPLAALGLISYSLYLWSVPIAVVFRSHFGPYTSFSATAVLSIGIATASWWLMERPLKAYRLKVAKPMMLAVTV
ncbi:acyltransferase [Mesorhizobium sp. VK23D]|nr:acyltransferase [Mesorhizobium sp. VK23D]